MSINGLFINGDIEIVISYLKKMGKEMLAHEVSLLIDDCKFQEEYIGKLEAKIIELYLEQSHLELCDFNDACDFCDNPHGKVYASILRSDVEEVKYYICTSCLFKRIMDSKNE